MCRLFITLFNGLCSKSTVLSTSNPLIESWKKATENDQSFFDFESLRQHDDGYGSFQYLLSPNNGKEQFTISKNFNPAFTVEHNLDLFSDNVSNFILLKHARKASKSMPISLDQNHPFSNETGTLILAHNGTLNKEIMLDLLKTKPDAIDYLSDTQLLFNVLKEQFDPSKFLDPNELFQAWKSLVDQIKKAHSNQNKHYSMNLLFLLKNQQTKSFNLLYTSCYSNPLAEDYLKFYLGKESNLDVLCSSTVVEYLERDYTEIFQKLNLHVIPNGTVGLISQEQKIGHIEESL